MTEDSEKPITRTADEARGGQIILKHRITRFIFIAALVGIVIVAAASYA